MGNLQHTDSLEQILQQFNAIDQRISHYKEVIALVYWDLQTTAPKKGKPFRSEAYGTLSSDMFHITLSDELKQTLEKLSEPEIYSQLDPVTQGKVRERTKEIEKLSKIPADLHKEYIIHTSKAHDVWEEAKSKNDFSIFQPALEKMVEYKRKFIELYGYEKHPYDALLDEYEPGITVEHLDPLFADLREKTIALLRKIQNAASQPRKDLFNQPFDIGKQKELSLLILSKLGYDFQAGRLDESVHPFATGINVGDVRITTRYMENDMRSSLFGSIHECGHALYEQGIDESFIGTVLADGTSMGIHESQSRFLENMIGRSFEFWKFFYPDVQQFFPEQFSSLDVEEFYRAVNVVEPTLIRVEADELTYNLHIIVRYEIEKGLMEGSMEVKDLPQIWNAKMEEYLGIRPTSYEDGVLQDIHWSMGGFGYFPSYSLGNLYAAQFANTLRKEFPHLDEIVAKGDFLEIREWLREKIHQYGRLYSPKELIMRVTGEELNANYLVEYLEQKYSNVYKL